MAKTKKVPAEKVRVRPEGTGKGGTGLPGMGRRERVFIMIPASVEYREQVARAAALGGLTTATLGRKLFDAHLKRVGLNNLLG